MESELELLEFQFPSMYPIGTYVKIIKVNPYPARSLRGTMVGKLGLVHSHRTKNGMRWHRVSMDNGDTYDFTAQELQKAE